MNATIEPVLFQEKGYLFQVFSVVPRRLGPPNAKCKTTDGMKTRIQLPFVKQNEYICKATMIRTSPFGAASVDDRQRLTIRFSEFVSLSTVPLTKRGILSEGLNRDQII